MAGLSPIRSARSCLFLAATLSLSSGATAATLNGDSELFDLSLSELLSLQITTASRKAEPVSQAAAAVFVITQEDIRRSGATSVPEALRMAPGVQVARIDANKWSISARGYNGRFANKLLVMIDGRSVYTPLFSGVYWDAQSPMLEDIERIEVIRGPGATLWGANAVNGVINIITKPSAETQGGLLIAAVGNEERAAGALRWGGTIGELGHYRVYGLGFDRDGTLDAAGRLDNADDWNGGKAGFRADLTPSTRDELALHGNFYQGDHGESVYDHENLANPYSVVDHTTEVTNLDLLAQWTRHVSETDDFTLKTYFDHTERDWARIGEERDTFDIELEYRTQRFDGHDLIFGLGYRYTSDQLDNTELVALMPDSDTLNLFSAFVQDDIQLVPDEFTLTLGAKIENNDITGFEVQPNLRLLWTPSQTQSIWGSIARAVRTPGRGELDGIVRQGVIAAGTALNPTSVPIETVIYGSDYLESEDLTAYELGYKWQVDRSLGVDLAFFYNDYQNLRTASFGDVSCNPSGIYPYCLFYSDSLISLVRAGELGNDASGYSKGVELAADWRPVSKWRLQAAYSYLQSHIAAAPTVNAVDDPRASPGNQFSLRSWFNPVSDIDLDFWLRYTDESLSFSVLGRTEIDPYWELDVHLAWRPSPSLELALVGQNLFNDAHIEGFSELGDLPLASLERSFYLKMNLDF
ncbi:TonB-dependent receptor [Thiorhodococcus mannitoliphagus]|uniref:TonB-dependent receptor n=1 Tax=Thiorhodococcus mannitoliphagus TaxID=329406 RepID=A0A6P1DW42_9GAMM|nr:TonB-dependent receptor [Thiorhodococcus mannitoliphagus]NEX21383.1 TonB-dependent receptor [Thiorhodococcus mannitoliphagus]